MRSIIGFGGECDRLGHDGYNNRNIMRSDSLPTDMQKDTVIFVSQLLSNLLQPVWMFRYDSIHKYIFLIAGREESLEITIFENGTWEFNKNDEA